MLGRRDHTPRLTVFAKRLGAQSTDAERKPWDLLRAGQLAGYRFRRQQPVAGYVVDFICLKANLVIELDGGQHTEPEANARDAQRTRQLQEMGLHVLRVPDDEILKDPDAVMRIIVRQIEAAKPSP